MRGRSGEIGTFVEQPGQPIVRPAAQLVGERSVPGRGHPAHAICLPAYAVNPVELHHGARTDVGLVREVNEDAYLAAPPVFVVADGMGGHEGGDVASAIVVEEFGRLADEGYDPRRGAEVVEETLRASQARIAEYAAAQRARGVPARFHAGTTVVVALLVEDDEGPKWLLANLGDSRIYRFADGLLEQVSVDHSVVQELVDAGAITEDDAAHPPRATRDHPGARRTPTAPRPTTSCCRCRPSSGWCSAPTGSRGMIDDSRWPRILAGPADPRDAADRMVARRLSPPVARTTRRPSSSMWWDW